MRFLLTAGLFTLLSSVLAQPEDPDADPLACDDYIATVENQAQLDVYSTCPVYQTTIFVGHNFSGPFKLPGIETLGRISAGYLLPKIPSKGRTDDAVTSISFPDLKNNTESYFGGIGIMYLDHLTDVSFPKLENMTGDLILLSNPKLHKAVFPALKSLSGGISIDGEFDEISFPSLKDVAFIDIHSTGNIDCRALGKNFSSVVYTAKEKPLYGDFGFICWTYNETNRWNSSDPEGNAHPSSTSTDGGSSATDLHIRFVNVVLAFVGIALVRGLFM
ncbi:hypothetical protein V490_05019 [Pseudogymnoascus sp. VKM F-3557]|nr:hypothetical protein V490_05019 [Pseudogymnoascus sp. VKM F-3557]